MVLFGGGRLPVENCNIGRNTVIFHENLVNLYGCNIGNGCKIGAFVEIQSGVSIGDNCKISSHSFICEGVTIGHNVFVGHGAIFVNDRFPRATLPNGELKGPKDWLLEATSIGNGVSIGSGAVIMCGIDIGENSLIGAGAVVTKSVRKNATVAGIPARLLSQGT